MATVSSVAFTEAGHSHTLSVVRLLIAGGVTAAAVFVLCWVGTFVPFSSPTHGYIGLFMNADISSGQALFEGTCWSLLFGALVGGLFGLVGGLFGLIYNTTAALGRK